MSIVNHPELLKESFLYFAKFPKKSGVQEIFRIGNSGITGYTALKAAIDAMATHSLVPEITNYLFSSNQEKLKKDIEDTKGIFMLLDYGQLSSSKDNMQRKNDEFELGIVIAIKMNPDDYDMPEIVLLSDQLLNAARKVRELMLEDSKCSPFVKQISFPHRISTWYARDLHNATGFYLMFNKTGIDMM